MMSMKNTMTVAAISISCLLAGTSCMTVGGPTAEEVSGYEDLADRSTNEFNPKQVYRMGQSGICGTVEDDHILVTHVIPGSPAVGKIQKGDRIRGMQHRGMGGWGGIRGLVGVRMYRLGRDWDWHFYVTVERDSLRGGKGNTVTYDLLMPPDPGNLCHYGPTGFFAKRHTDHLVVDVVEKGSPSDDKLQKGDVIVAVAGQPITLDAYRQFTEAIDEAESEQGGGLLTLTVQRGGAANGGAAGSEKDAAADAEVADHHAPASAAPRTETVTLQLKVLGRYSKTAPAHCPKTDALITQAADHLVKTGSYGTLKAGLLGLLATGEETYIKAVHDILHAAAWAQRPEDVTELVGKGVGYCSWHWGYQLLVLTEYYLVSGDAFVLPAITKYALGLASGQDNAGLWGHTMSVPELGRSRGYGVMNQPSLSIFISLILAEKCGVKDPMVRRAIERTHAHFDNWIGRGALPYGNHQPMEHLFTNNGTSGSLAIAFALLGNSKGASFYAAMSAAATDEILTGHGGPWWNITWSGLGANVLGPEMATAYNKKGHWLRTAARCWDGRYVEMLGWGSSPQGGRCSDTGAHLLNLCTGRRAIYITGKGMDKSLWVTATSAGEIVEAGTIDDSSETALLAQLGSFLPPVRLRSAQALAMRDADVADKVMKLLADGNPNQRIGAIHAIQNLRIEDAADGLLAVASDEEDDIWVRQLAVQALAGMKHAKPFAPELLRVLVANRSNDPYRELDLAIGQALNALLAPDPYATNLDKDLFYEGVARLLNHKHVSGRGAGMALLKNIPMDDLPRIIDRMVYVIEDKDTTYTSYTGAGRQEALNILYRLGIKESMDYTVSTIKESTGREGPRVRDRTRLLSTFGAEAKYLIPRIKEVLGKDADPIVKQIEESETERKMIPLSEVSKMGKHQ